MQNETSKNGAVDLNQGAITPDATRVAESVADPGSAKRAGQTNDEKRREFVEYVKAVDGLLSPGVLDLIVERVLRDVYRKNPRLKKTPKREAKTVIQKIFNIAPGAFERSIQIHGALCRENDRTEKLIAELRQVRAELLAAGAAVCPKT